MGEDVSSETIDGSMIIDHPSEADVSRVIKHDLRSLGGCYKI